jgi:hypothetical protein
MNHTLKRELAFAGFAFPKYVWTLPQGPLSKRLERAKVASTGPYYHSPKPNQCGALGFYLDSDGAPGLRWRYCDDIARSIGHTGWFTDEYGDSETIRGIVMRLPANRGFLAGWTMGEGMASAIDADIYDDETAAAYAADSMAEHVAEREREFTEDGTLA